MSAGAETIQNVPSVGTVQSKKRPCTERVNNNSHEDLRPY